MLTLTEYRVIKILAEERFDKIKKKVSDKLDKNYIGLKTLVDKASKIISFALGNIYHVPEDKESKIDWVMKASQELGERYSKTRDMSLTFEYDRMKKENGMILFLLGDLKAEFDTNKDFAKSDLKVLLYRISEEYRKEDPKMSVTMADRKAELDNRYLLAKEEYRLYLTYANTIKTRYEVCKDLGQAILQSVSTARVGMVQESYNDNGGKAIDGSKN